MLIFISEAEKVHTDEKGKCQETKITWGKDVWVSLQICIVINTCNWALEKDRMWNIYA